MTLATDAAREARAWDMLCARLQRDPKASEESDTCSLRSAWKAMLAFADTEAASQPREGKHRVCPWCAAKAVLVHPPRYEAHYRAGCGNERCEVKPFAKGTTIENAWDAWDSPLLTQRPPEQAGAVPANVRRLVIAAREVFDGAGICFPEADALDKALEPFSALVPYENQPEDAGSGSDGAGERECPSSPDGKHQVDTSMESGPNNCFHCEASMRATQPGDGGRS